MNDGCPDFAPDFALPKAWPKADVETRLNSSIKESASGQVWTSCGRGFICNNRLNYEGLS